MTLHRGGVLCRSSFLFGVMEVMAGASSFEDARVAVVKKFVPLELDAASAEHLAMYVYGSWDMGP